MQLKLFTKITVSVLLEYLYIVRIARFRLRILFLFDQQAFGPELTVRDYRSCSI